MLWSILNNTLGRFAEENIYDKLPGDTLRDSIKSAEKLKARISKEEAQQFDEKFNKKLKEAGFLRTSPIRIISNDSSASDTAIDSLIGKLQKDLKDGNT